MICNIGITICALLIADVSIRVDSLQCYTCDNYGNVGHPALSNGCGNPFDNSSISVNPQDSCSICGTMIRTDTCRLCNIGLMDIVPNFAIILFYKYGKTAL